MRITDILTEDKQLDELNLGKAVGKAVGGVAKGIGAVAGGIAGIPAAVKKGFQAGKRTVAGDDEPAATTAAGAAPAPTTAAAPSQTAAPAPTTAAAPKKSASAFSRLSAAAQGAEPAATAAPTTVAAPAQTTAPAQPQTAQTAQQTAPAAQASEPTAAASPTLYAQVKSQIDQLDKKGKQRILQFLQKSSPAPAGQAQKPMAATNKPTQAGQGLTPKLAGEEPTAAKPATTKPAATEPRGDVEVLPTDKFNPNTGEMTPQYKADLEKRLKSLQKKPAATATTAKPAATTAPAATPNADDDVGQAAISAYNTSNGDMDAAEKAALDKMKAKNPKLAGMMQQAGMDEPAKKQTKKVAKKPSQAEIDAERDRLMGNFTDSKNYQNKVRI